MAPYLCGFIASVSGNSTVSEVLVAKLTCKWCHQHKQHPILALHRHESLIS